MVLFYEKSVAICEFHITLFLMETKAVLVQQQQQQQEQYRQEEDG
jgi:hypothetical protein